MKSMKQVGVWGFHRNADDIPVGFFLTAGSIWVVSHHPLSGVYVRVPSCPPVHPVASWLKVSGITERSSTTGGLVDSSLSVFQVCDERARLCSYS